MQTPTNTLRYTRVHKHTGEQTHGTDTTDGDARKHIQANRHTHTHTPNTHVLATVHPLHPVHHAISVSSWLTKHPHTEEENK